MEIKRIIDFLIGQLSAIRNALKYNFIDRTRFANGIDALKL